ncbi:hypothetical protein FB004_111154 [Sinorhizobium medicae]|nr:hypothetical protein FB006_12649 [Sinorhizobium medicae]TWA20228.1 hypothetical protein FB004_111154 [Sinorhizobium medicae]TWA31304.1 hypothetical protein FB009_13824 [Sinorhizobium medicae]TWA31372.1 hypothetical protein FB007_1131 [Sinorhizobium medicae]TWA36110.1 hypothetical protein FB005_1261 [Sinorhizobium medicae]
MGEPFGKGVLLRFQGSNLFSLQHVLVNYALQRRYNVRSK